MMPDHIAILPAFQAFGPDGHLVDPKQESKLKALGTALAEHLREGWDSRVARCFPSLARLARHPDFQVLD